MIPPYQYDGVVGYNFARIGDKNEATRWRAGGHELGIASGVGNGVGAGALWIQPVAAEPQVGAVGQQEYLGATGTRVSGAARDLAYNETVYADERVDTGRNADSHTSLVFLDRTNSISGRDRPWCSTSSSMIPAVIKATSRSRSPRAPSAS